MLELERKNSFLVKLIFIFIDWQGYIHNIHQFYIIFIVSSFLTGNPDEFGKPLNERRPFLPRCRRHAHLFYAGCNKIIIMVEFSFYEVLKYYHEARFCSTHTEYVLNTISRGRG